MKKAQTEIMGLLIIVLIIFFIMIYALKFVIQPVPDIVGPYTQKELASSLVGAILITSSNCTDDTNFKKVLIDCARYPEEGSGDLICNNGMQSCDFASKQIGEILNDTLEVWKRPYEFKVVASSDVEIQKLHFEGAAKGRGNIASETYPIPIDTSGDTMAVRLCIGGSCPDI